MREIADWIVWILLLLCGICDYKKREIPVVLLVVMSVFVTVSMFCFRRDTVFGQGMGIFLGILFFIISKYTGQAVGYGDSWIILLLGAYLGVFKALQVLFFAAMAAGIYSLCSLWKHRWKRNIAIPFVPFVVVAYVGVLCL